MSDPQRRWRFILLACAVGALVLLAGGLSNLTLSEGSPLPIGPIFDLFAPSGGGTLASGDADTLRTIIQIVVWVIIPLLIVMLVVSRSFRREFFGRLGAGLLLALMVYIFISVFRSDEPRDMPPGPAQGLGGLPQGSGTMEQMPAAPDFVTNPPQWILFTITFLIVALILFLIWKMWPRKLPEIVKTSPLDLLTDEAQNALDDLRAGADLRDTVLRCYAEMNRILRESRGVLRSEAMTPREFELQLSHVGFGDEHIVRLTRLFERIRYGQESSSARDAAEAEACLEALVQQYGRAQA
jgi:hypothetical protein